MRNLIQMKITYCLLFLIIGLFSSCNTYVSENDLIEEESTNHVEIKQLINTNKRTIFAKFKTPEGFERVKPLTEFGLFLNHLPLKSDKLKVKLYDGSVKANQENYVAVIDLPQSTNNIQYNANAIIRLRAEYLYKNKLYDQIDFKVNNYVQALTYKEFVKGDYSYKKFTKYLEYFLPQTTSSSITNNLISVDWKEMQIGDVFVQKSNIRGHAAIVADMAKNDEGQKIFLLAQSYYPGQDLHIIANPNDEENSPWYTLQEGVILTPEWRFLSSDLMRFN